MQANAILYGTHVMHTTSVGTAAVSVRAVTHEGLDKGAEHGDDAVGWLLVADISSLLFDFSSGLQDGRIVEAIADG